MSTAGRPNRVFRVTVYASSSERVDASYMAVAGELGRLIAERGWDLVWGGGRFGLMGALSRAARQAGGRTLGIILQDFIDKNVHCTAAHRMESVTDMRSRKQGLDEAGDAFMALPGGLGTLEELLEVLSFKQLGLHDKPIVILDARGYWGPLLATLDKAFVEGFIQPHFRGLYTVAATPEEAIQQVENTRPWRQGGRDPLGGGTS